MSEETIQIHKTEKPNSYEFGKAGNRFKIYFEDSKDLKTQLDELDALGLLGTEVQG